MSTDKSSASPSNIRVIREIATGIYQIQMPLATKLMANLDHTNVYLIKATTGWILIDSGWYTLKAQNTLEAALKSLSLTFPISAQLSSLTVTLTTSVWREELSTYLPGLEC